MKNIYVIIFCLMSLSFFGQTPGAFPRILSKPKQACDNEVLVKDLYTDNCNYEVNCNYMYPVLIEDFNDNFDLPNKWRFDFGFTQNDDVDGKGFSTWFGDAYFNNLVWPSTITNHNIKLNNGIATFLNIEETVSRNNNDVISSYPFTSGMIQSLSHFRTGVFEARIKIPSANKMWPAFWLLNNKSHYAEIDIFEFYDDNVGSNPNSNSNCDTYNLHKMSIHSGAVNNDCPRSDKYPLNINTFHDYKLVWNDYETFIFVDGNLKGYAAKYLRNSTLPVFPCLYGYSGNYFDPAENYSCNQIQLMPDNLFPTVHIDFGPKPWYVPSWAWPPPQPPQPYLANKLRKDSYFPGKDNAMSLLLNNSINRTYVNDGFSNFSQNELNMEVDWIHVYQPFCCGIDKMVCSLADLDNQTYSTDILTGRKLTISNNSCFFEQNKPGRYINGGTSGPQDWRDQPVILLATEEIAINSYASFPGGTYAEMRITTCGSASKINSDESNQVDDFYQSQKNVTDSISNIYAQKVDSIIKSEYESTMKTYKDQYDSNNNGDLNIGPVPTVDYLEVLCSDTVYEKIVSLVLIDVYGKEYSLLIQRNLNIEIFKEGFYQLKILFNDGTYSIKKVIKT